MEKITDYKVTQQEIETNGMQAVPGEVMYGEPADNKRRLDQLAVFIANKYNLTADWLVGKAHIHENKELIDTIQGENVHAHANKEIIDTIQEENVHAHANKTVLDMVVKDTQVHEHTNKAIIDTIQEENVHAHPNKSLLDMVSKETQIHDHDNKALLDTVKDPSEIHSHANKEFLDSIDNTYVHTHPNKAAIDTITFNMISSWNASAGIQGGITNLDFGAFLNNQDSLQIRRGEAKDIPLLKEGEFAFTRDEIALYIGHASGNQKIALEKDIVPQLVNYYTKDETDTKLAEHYKKTETYTKQETDNAINTAIQQNITAALNASY